MGEKQDTLFSLYLPLHASKRNIEGHKLEFITTIMCYIYPVVYAFFYIHLFGAYHISGGTSGSSTKSLETGFSWA